MNDAVRPAGGSSADNHAPTEFSSRDHRLFALVALIAMSVLTCFVGLHEGPPMGDHECINALAARNALQTGRCLIPYVDDTPRIRKTPLGIWSIGAASSLVGSPQGAPPVTPLSARLPSALAGIGTVLVVVWLGSMLYGGRAGLVGGFICAGCAATVTYSRNAQVDMMLTFFTALAFACFWRGAMQEQPSRWSMAAFYFVFAMAMMAKTPLPLATVGVSLFAYWFLTAPLLALGTGGQQAPGGSIGRLFHALVGQIAGLRTLWLLPGIAVFLIVVGAWPAYVSTRVDNALGLWRIEYLSRFTGELSDKTRPFWYYVPFIFGLTLPFMLSIPEAVLAPFLPRYAAQRRGLA